VGNSHPKMPVILPMTSQTRDPRYWYSIWQFALSLLAAFGLAIGAGLAILFGLMASFGLSSAADAQMQQLSMFMLAGGLLTCGLLLLPSAYYAWRRFSGRPVRQFPALPKFLRPNILILTLPLVLLLGYEVAKFPSISWLFLPLLHVLAVGLPVLWIVSLAIRALPVGSPQRLWGVFGSGLVLGPLLIMALEIAALIGFILIGILILISQPGLMEQLQTILESLQQGVATQEELIQMVVPWLARPGVILVVVAFAAVIVPMIEESIKPIGVWLLAGFNLTPAAGFAAGALSGAGYAFFESLALAGSGADWTVSTLTRIPTAVIHILNTALMGWAIVLAWREKRYLYLILIYLTVIVIHGTWNGLAIVSAVDSLLSQQGLTSPFASFAWLGPAAPFLLGGMTIGAFTLLLWMNRRLRPVPLAQSVSPALAIELSEDQPAGDVL
jgi:hypothetical protein